MAFGLTEMFFFVINGLFIQEFIVVCVCGCPPSTLSFDNFPPLFSGGGGTLIVDVDILSFLNKDQCEKNE